MAILTDVWSGRPSTLAQTQQSRSKVCLEGGRHCLPSTRSECRRGNGGSRICTNATYNTLPPKQHSNHSYPLLLSSPSHHFLLSSRASTMHRVPRYLGNYLISLDDDGPSFDKVILSICNLQCRQDVAWSILLEFNRVHACALFVTN